MCACGRERVRDSGGRGAGRVAIDVRGRERSRVSCCGCFRVDDGPLSCCVPEPHGEGTWVLDVVPMMQQLLGCVECVSWQVLLGG